MNERMKQPTVCAHTPASKDGLQGTPLQLLRTVEQWSSVSGGQPAAAARYGKIGG